MFDLRLATSDSRVLQDVDGVAERWIGTKETQTQAPPQSAAQPASQCKDVKGRKKVACESRCSLNQVSALTVQLHGVRWTRNLNKHWNVSGVVFRFYSEPRLDFLLGSDVLQSSPYFSLTSLTNTRCGQSLTLMLLKVSCIFRTHTHTNLEACLFHISAHALFSLCNNVKYEYSSCRAFPCRTPGLMLVT